MGLGPGLLYTLPLEECATVFQFVSRGAAVTEYHSLCAFSTSRWNVGCRMTFMTYTSLLAAASSVHQNRSARCVWQYLSTRSVLSQCELWCNARPRWFLIPPKTPKFDTDAKWRDGVHQRMHPA